MKLRTLVLASTLASLAFLSTAHAQSCSELVHERTGAPLNEITSQGIDLQDGFEVVKRTKNTRYAPMGVLLDEGEITTSVYQCNDKGQYRELYTDLSPATWGRWRSPNDWDAMHWVKY